MSTNLGDFPMKVEPVLKWAGGKRALLTEINSLIAQVPITSSSRYFEPFLGGASVLLSRTEPITLHGFDANSELINFYLVVANGVELELMKDLLMSWPITKEQYLEVRAWDRGPLFAAGTSTEGRIWRAARMLYLNRLAFNGLYRENSSGHFNVPFGSLTEKYQFDFSRLDALNSFLTFKMPNGEPRVILGESSFQNAVLWDSLGSADIVYLDPPYDIEVGQNSFASYHRSVFGPQEQEALAALFRTLAGQGVPVILSNAKTKRIEELYADFWGTRLQPKIRRSIAADSKKRVNVDEVIIHANIRPKGSLGA